jgi:hypothetical protein
MSGDDDRLKKMVQQASGILTAANGKVKIVQAMELVGFTSDERRNMKLYQQVRRLSTKLVILNPTAKKTPSSAVTESQGSTISSITGDRSYAQFSTTPSSYSDDSTVGSLGSASMSIPLSVN